MYDFVYSSKDAFSTFRSSPNDLTTTPMGGDVVQLFRGFSAREPMRARGRKNKRSLRKRRYLPLLSLKGALISGEGSAV
jgi:hypothetical protein